jgi:hypothetical protein
MKGIAVAFPLLLLAAAGYARNADSVLSVLEKAGQMGSWAATCSQPPSKNNLYVVFYATTDGKVRRKIDRGSDGPGLDGAVDSAERESATTLRMRTRNDDPNWGETNGRYFDIVVEIADGRVRSLSSVDGNGTKMIEGGVLLATQQPTPLFQRCKGGRNA